MINKTEIFVGKWDFKCPVCCFINARSLMSLQQWNTTHATFCTECFSKIKLLGDPCNIHDRTIVLEAIMP